MQHSPIIIIENGSSRILQPLKNTVGPSPYSEAWIRDLIFHNPISLPVDEIEPSFAPLIPICTELDTRVAGFADALFINTLGMPTLLESKLWRNPEARREVVGQILDYARVLRRWTYNDLQRESARARKEQGFNLAEFVRLRSGVAAFDEATFCDNVTRNLARSRILLLIVGDGIREGVEAIADYVQQSTGLHFTLGLVEVPIFEVGPETRIVQPRVLARTAIINRTVVGLASETLEIQEGDEQGKEGSGPKAPELGERERYLLEFWTELLVTLSLDDVEQPLGKANATSNIYFPMPAGSHMWLTCYFFQKESKIGIFLGSDRTSSLALQIGLQLQGQKDPIDREFLKAGLQTSWSKTEGGKTQIEASKKYKAVLDPANRADQLAWFTNAINAFVNVLRPRISAMVDEATTPASKR
jgi:hypothetical protein